jgi:hypothetical protein
LHRPQGHAVNRLFDKGDDFLIAAERIGVDVIRCGSVAVDFLPILRVRRDGDQSNGCKEKFHGASFRYRQGGRGKILQSAAARRMIQLIMPT